MLNRKRTSTTEDETAAEPTARDGDHAATGDPAATTTERRHVAHDEALVHGRHETAKERYGGVNAGAAFFGWLVAVALTILLTGTVGALAAAISREADVTRSDAELEAGTIGLAAAIVLLVVLTIAYYIGGYVAGRMSRFDGAKQGAAVWFMGLLVTIVAGVIGAVAGEQYDVLDRVDLPNVPIPDSELSSGGIITAIVLVVVTLLAAMAGGKVGRNYHKKVDAAHLP
jgi:hypothetical protein